MTIIQIWLQLHVSAANGYLLVTEFLLEQHVSVDLTDNDTWQPIHCAACWGQVSLSANQMRRLMGSGQSLNQSNAQIDGFRSLSQSNMLIDGVRSVLQPIKRVAFIMLLVQISQRPMEYFAF